MTIDGIMIFIAFIGGLGLFIYGMQEMANGLQNAAGKKMQYFLEVLTRNRFMGVITGAFVTMAIQSSSATTVMVVGFVNAQLMSLTQSVGIIMGANIGTTITSWIVASSEWATFLKPTTIAPLTVAIGVLLMVATKKDKYQYLGQVLVGFGILFIGIEAMSDSMKPLRDSPVFQQVFISLGSNPILGILAGAAITCIIQSSSASVGILQSIAILGLVPWSAAVYIILGQNIGTCITAILSSIGTSKNAKAAAYIHLLFNIVGSLIFMVGAVVYFTFINPTVATMPASATDISIFHSAFNISAMIMLFPFGNLLVRGASKMAGIKEGEQAENKHAHLDDRLLENPSIAIGVGLQEILRMGEVCITGMNLVKDTTLNKNKESIDNLFAFETEINEYEATISDYLAKIIRKEISDKEKNVVTGYFHTISDLERVGDHLENIAELGDILINEDISFSGDGSDELENLIDVTNRCLLLSCEALKESNIEKANEAIRLEDEIDKLCKISQDNHVLRLSEANCNVRSGILFLELLTNLERISDHANNIAEFVIATKKTTVKKHV